MSRLCAAVLCLAVATATAPVAAQTIANGPYYATPSWDLTLSTGSRFVVLANFANQAVLDRETGLVWARSPLADKYVYAKAFDVCMRTPAGSRFGWRLPSMPELASLFDPTPPQNGALPVGHPFTNLPGTPDSTFWSTTVADAGDSLEAHFGWLLRMDPTAGNLAGGGDQQPEYAWCVRGPGDAGSQKQ